VVNLKNKANLPDAKMNVKSFQERDYDDFAALRQQKNKAKRRPLAGNPKLSVSTDRHAFRRIP